MGTDLGKAMAETKAGCMISPWMHIVMHRISNAQHALALDMFAPMTTTYIFHIVINHLSWNLRDKLKFDHANDELRLLREGEKNEDNVFQYMWLSTEAKRAKERKEKEFATKMVDDVTRELAVFISTSKEQKKTGQNAKSSTSSHSTASHSTASQSMASQSTVSQSTALQSEERTEEG